MRCVIIAGGPVKDYEKVRLFPGDMIICADSGARHAEALGAVPHVIVGDMDSIDPGMLAEFEKKGSRVKRFPAGKDEVDTELALNEAISARPDEIVIYGGTGDRLDHTLAVVQLLEKAARTGIRAFVEDHLHRVTLVTPDLSSAVEGSGTVFSLLPLTSGVYGVTVRGAAWDLENAEFTLGKPYGVSNRVLADRAEISVGEGLLLLIVII